MENDRPQSPGNNFFTGACGSTKNLALLVQRKKKIKSQVHLELLLQKSLADGSCQPRNSGVHGFPFLPVPTAVFGSMYPQLLISVDLHKGVELVAWA
jgi:hypothetical protein